MQRIPQVFQQVVKTNQINTQKDIKNTTKNRTFPKVDNKKLAASISAGIGITALVIGGVLYRMKIDATKFKQLAENIDFKECDNLQDAINFGKKYLGIKKYKGFEDKDLDVVNWINQGLVTVNNTTKAKAKMPNRIVFKSCGNNAAQMNSIGTLSISKDNISEIKDAVRQIPEEMGMGQKNTNNFTDSYNTFLKIIKAHPEFSNSIEKQAHTSTFSIINHEMGHWQHSLNTKMCLPEIEKKHEKLFSSSKDIAARVSDYATTSPAEFVAECYSKMIDYKRLNKTPFDDEVLALYKKMGGPEI